MNIPFLDNWRKRNGEDGGVALSDALSGDPEGVSQLLSECELLRDQARRSGVELDDTADSLAALDQLVPRWRDDPEVAQWLGADAGLYLGTVIVRTVPGSAWTLRSDGQPVVRLASGREMDVLEDGRSWAETGTPELAQSYAEDAED
ncbi:DUF6278 family protein [Streptomyces sp. Z26]|uniref:DUF6278 family protein n=1 Tax=Streptomyces TaxID=1883 RepID=UPI000EF14260|nr:DUF6278 family protein [Streptomyces sp. Z26]RLL69523.1 hypothetical protein D7M15_24880 [Streptomyces sp. Z26]